MATQQKKSAPRKRPAARKPRKPKKKSASSLQRFLVSFTSTTAVVFSVASVLLNPHLVEGLRHLPYVSSLPSLLQIGMGEAPTTVTPHTARTPPTPSTQVEHVDRVASGHTVTRFAQCPQFFPGGQAPQLPAGSHLRELCFNAFAVLYNGQTKTPFVVVERLNRATILNARRQHRTDKFYAEARLPRTERAALEDYKGSGYARGHMAPAADMSTPEAMAQSFSLANMVPQNQAHNAGNWSRVEQDTRKYVLRARGDVFVYTGPLFDAAPRTVGSGRVAVPSQLFKLVYDPGTGKSWAYVQANRQDSQAGAPMQYADFALKTGLRLLPQGSNGV